jgi:hypothetical protein
MKNETIHKLYIYTLIGIIILMNLDIQDNILASIKALTLQCKPAYQIVIPDDNEVENY